MFPETLYMSGLGKVVYLFLYMPLILFLMWWTFQKFKSAGPVLIVISLVLISLPWWDVYMISRDAERLCHEQGGLHVYRTVEAEGFIGDSGIEKWSKLGFKYVESGGGDYKYIHTVNGEQVIRKKVQNFISRYHVRPGDDHKEITENISSSSLYIFDLQRKEKLSELMYFHVYPGEFERILFQVLPIKIPHWFCGNELITESKSRRLGSSDLIIATIKPFNEVGK